MKYGPRKPSISRSISARTKGQLTRAAKRSINPVYGKRGTGVYHPKRAAYNYVYKRTTYGISDVTTKQHRHTKNDIDYSYSYSIPYDIETDYNLTDISDDYDIPEYTKPYKRKRRTLKVLIRDIKRNSVYISVAVMLIIGGIPLFMLIVLLFEIIFLP